jgi:hypothetical protein
MLVIIVFEEKEAVETYSAKMALVVSSGRSASFNTAVKT